MAPLINKTKNNHVNGELQWTRKSHYQVQGRLTAARTIFGPPSSLSRSMHGWAIDAHACQLNGLAT
jgi:hypothetical protein